MLIWTGEKTALKTRLKLWDGGASLVVVGSGEDEGAEEHGVSTSWRISARSASGWRRAHPLLLAYAMPNSLLHPFYGKLVSGLVSVT